MAVPVRSCCFFFNLRQGSMLIAVIELLLSAIALFLLLLGSAHAQEVAAMLEADMEDSERDERMLVVPDRRESLLWLQPHHFNNQMRLQKAQHLALVMIVGLYTGIALVTIHLISCVLLLYGAIMRVRQFLLPWISIVLISLAFSLTGLLVSMLLRRGTVPLLLVTALGMQIRLFSWLVVYSYYRHLYEAQSTSCAMMVQQDAKAVGNGYMNFPHYYKPAEV
ncbi:uncharacterized protein LOC134537597 [Bacillus rossius redtenbacheri]|uniref:uncharacterized protein LOC134537597 n=1 Tax=Bacillus rossius redtenbacheri TaxID=93214 RepID=UPI002FDCA559